MDRTWFHRVRAPANVPRRSTLQINLPITFRFAEREDLPKLEWGGEYTHFRRVFQQTLQEQRTGTRLMLLAIFNGYPVGQLFIQLASFDDLTTGKRAYFYSLRVMTAFQRQGIGTALMGEGEAILIERQYESVSIAAAKTNHPARKMYERLGYHLYAEDPGRWSYVDHEGRTCQVIEPCFLLDKHFHS